jgi:phytoene dehydrogenase-like protein
MELVRLLHGDLERFMAPEILLEIPELTDGGMRRDHARWTTGRREALTRAEREGTRPNTPAWARIDAPHVTAGRTLAAELRAQADRAERAALEQRAAVLRLAAPATADPVVETRRRESRDKLLRQVPEASDRLQRCLTAAQESTAEARELLEAVLTEPAPREVLTPGQRAALEAEVVRRRAPDVVRGAYRAQQARRVAIDIQNACGDPTFIKVGP